MTSYQQFLKLINLQDTTFKVERLKNIIYQNFKIYIEVQNQNLTFKIANALLYLFELFSNKIN